MEHLISPRHDTHVVIANPFRHPAEILAREFTLRGYVPHLCANGKSLLAQVRVLRPALVVSELRLHDGPNLKGLSKIRQEFPEVHIVVVTGHSSIATMVACHRIGIHGYLPRGSSAEHILSSLKPSLPPPVHPQTGQASHFNRLCWEYINRIVEYAGSISQAADLLGLDRRSLRRMLSSFAPHE